MTFEEKLNSYLRRQEYRIQEAADIEAQDLSDHISELRCRMTSGQREEATRVVEYFFDKGEELDICDALFPVIKVAMDIPVRKLATSSSIEDVLSLVDDNVTQRFSEMGISEEYLVNVSYLGTYNLNTLIPAYYGSERAITLYRITIEFEL